MNLLDILLPRRRMLDQEIKNLEEKLGLIERNTETLFYDPHYIRNNSLQTRKDYLEELKTITRKDEDVIPTLETWHIQTRISGNFPTEVGFLLRKELFKLPEGINFKELSSDKELTTLFKCGNLNNYDFIRFPILDFSGKLDYQTELEINRVRKYILINWKKEQHLKN